MCRITMQVKVTSQLLHIHHAQLWLADLVDCCEHSTSTFSQHSFTFFFICVAEPDSCKLGMFFKSYSC